MEIKPNRHLETVHWIGLSHGQAVKKASSQEDALVAPSTRALEAKLQELPDVRPEKVEQALALIGDPIYPPRETLNGLAALLAVHLGKSSQP